jgi:hypothetical protein
VALINDYGNEKEEVHFLKLKTPISMIEIELKSNNNNKLEKNDLKINLKEAQGGTILDQNRDMEKDTIEPKSLISQAQNPSNNYSFDDVCQLNAFLTKIDPRTKIKVKIGDFESFRQFLPLVNKYSAKFALFKYETNFITIPDNTQKCKLAELTTFKESFTNWLKNQKIDPKIVEILQKEVE